MNTYDDSTHSYYIDGVKVPSVTELTSPITATKYAIGSELIENARHRGSRVHELCEAYDYDILEEVEPELIGYLQAYVAFVRDYRPTWLYIEHRMYSRNDMFAGTADRIGKIDGRLWIVDLKTTSSMDRQSKIALAAQMEGYATLAAENGIGSDFCRMGVQLKNDGKYTVHTSEAIELSYDFQSADLFDQLTYFYKLTEGAKHAKRN